MPAINATQSFVSGASVATRTRAPKVDSGLYKMLFQVLIRHGYNDDTKSLCGSFRIEPSPASAALMVSQGMVFHDDGVGFSVYIQESKIQSFVLYLRQQATSWANLPTDAAPNDLIQYWTRMSFVLVQTDAFFVGTTSLPIDTNPLLRNVYGSNLNAHLVPGHDIAARKGRVLVLAPAPRRTMDGDDLQFVTGPQFPVEVPGYDSKVLVADISGKVVLVQPPDTAVTAPTPLQPPAKAAAPPAPVQSPPPVYVQVDLSSLPLGLYSLTIVPDPTQIADQQMVLLYTGASRGVPLAFLEMLFTSPYKGKGGIYPVPPLWSGMTVPDDAVGGRVYELNFETRQTWWQYYVVSQTPGSTLKDLAITGKGASFTVMQDTVTLPNGETAVQINSNGVLALRAVSPRRFTLTATRVDADGSESPVKLNPLPVGPIAPVWPAVSPVFGDAQGAADPPMDLPSDAYGTSEMFVYV